jgi:hypothetical protein
LSLFDTAPVVCQFDAHFAASPERVWESLTSDESIAAWGRGVESVRWLSPRPFGPGTRREVRLARGSATVREEFFRWDEGRGYSFFATESSRPGLHRLAEDYVVSPAGTGTSLTWRIAVEPVRRFAPVAPFAAPVVRLLFGQLVRDGKRYFAR